MSALHDAELRDSTVEYRHVRERAQKRREQRLRMQFSYTGISRTVLERPEWQPLIARVGASVGELARGIDRVEYVERVCLDVISARVRPRHPYPSRFLTAAGSASSDGLQAAGGREVTV